MQKYKDIQDFVRAITTGSGFPGVVVVDNDNVKAYIGDDDVFDFDEGSPAEVLVDLLSALGVESVGHMTHNDMPPRKRFNQGDQLPISIRQGAILVNDATVERDHGDCILVYVDLTSKYARLSATGGGDHCGPSLVLYADTETLDIAPGKTAVDLTMIEFPTLVGWRIFSANEPQRYTLALTLVAPQGKL